MKGRLHHTQTIGHGLCTTATRAPPNDGASSSCLKRSDYGAIYLTRALSVQLTSPVAATLGMLRQHDVTQHVPSPFSPEDSNWHALHFVLYN
ncbi:hypothetical protein EVAR_103456_1 [Eumeta japonica]|uniref:Uncharacterized protein n=1 Tax=Eumeta variegata TaxID=151549 RepID=A0A4C1YYJ9_EUMVA|nr:hypothetical protein EVAR_103456_1 [Eumeta japonica]